MESAYSIPHKVLEYETFLNETLRKDLARVEELAEKCFAELENYLQIQTFVKQLKEKTYGPSDKLKVQSDIGSNFYVQCVIPDAKKIFVYCGLGFYVELSLDEAMRFIEKKEVYLRSKLEIYGNQENKIKAHIKLVLEGLRELQQFKA
ncbi:Protein UXT [Halotydeus destructor]|nr:Protein UXT [Halotydeus destructor]